MINPEKIQPIKEHLSGIEREFKERSSKPKFSLQNLPRLNEKMWGLKEGLTIVGGRTSQGKSAFINQVAFDLADQHIPVLLLSLEMTVESLIERLFSNVMKVNNQELLQGKMNSNDEIKAKWEHFKTMVAEIPLLITCGIGRSYKEVNYLIQKLDPKPKVIIVDYIQGIVRKANESREMINEYIREFREICLINRIAGILVSQNNRQALNEKGKEPTLSTLKETGTLEEHADTVILLHWGYYHTYQGDSRDYKIILAKQRNGNTGFHMVHFYPEYYRFEETY